MISDIGFVVSTIGMIAGTVGIIAIREGEKKNNKSLEDLGHLALMFGGITLLYGLNIK